MIVEEQARRWAAVLTCVAAGTLALPAGAAGQEATRSDPADGRLTVLARNLYLGADVGVALDLLPDMPAAAQFMWEQVAATDFDSRVASLAQEVDRHDPDVIGLQEAAVWSCRPDPVSAAVPVFDFTAQFLAAAADAGAEYVVAGQGDAAASNPGYQIPAIPFLTTVTDPETFRPLFGKDSVDCGFTIADVLLVRADLADSVVAAGTSEYDERYAVAPVVFTIDRGYAWADLAVEGTTVRVVTTHLESQWDPGDPVPGAVQARQLVDDLSTTSLPLVVMGDFNADPRDPRGAGAPNPGEQPTASDVCPGQVQAPTPQTADASCNAYWTMLAAGFTDAGPDAFDPQHHTWGSAGDLAGPDPDRLQVALEAGNPAGFTDRLDYVFLGNGAVPVSAEIIGNEWPVGDDLWPCTDPSQVSTTEQSSAILAAGGLADPITGDGVCLPTDHAGVVAVVDVSAGPAGVVTEAAPPAHDSFRIGMLGWLGVVLGVLVLIVLVLIGTLTRWARRRRRRRTSP
jgi:hypothetical protein